MTTLVTGTTGFVGSAVARALLRAGHTVRALVRPASDRRNLDGLALEVVEGDLTDRRSLKRAAAGCEALFHVAADYRLWVPDPARMYENNIAGTRNILWAAAEAGVGRMVYTSSVATLGHNRDGRPADESTPVTLDDMIGHYKRSKFLAEAQVRELCAKDRLPVVIVNPSTPVGPRDIKPTPTGRMIADAAAGRMPAYVDTGLNLVSVGDVAIGHLLAFDRGRIGERYILGGEDMPLRTILETIAAITGRRPPRWRLPHAAVLPVAYLAEGWARLAGSGDPRVTVDGVRLSRRFMFFSSEKARRELGFTVCPVHEALAEAVDWFGRHNPPVAR
ncbi:MAG: NAD-dependent epimerase/dehydratase family protein [Pseudomonadota bacterium]|nr:NAD-dependent epimerase/dehydratase family protein [Pseudomonadota bacterium]